MKVLVLTSGGDAPGMNMVLFQLYKRFGHNLYACRAGFKGLINNDIIPISEFKPLGKAKQAGSIIKCSRCPEFKTEAGFNQGLENAKRFDVVVVLGGNGSYKGCKQLNDNGVRTVFIPATIDNDVHISDYSLGYHTAVQACVKTIENVMPSMDAFDRACIFEVMGRNCPRIAKGVNLGYPCDYMITSKKDIDYKKIAEIIKNNHDLGKGSAILLKERIIKNQTLIKNLNKLEPKIEIKAVTVGYTQRGSAPTDIDLEYARKFAKFAINIIAHKKISGAIIYKKNKFYIINNDDEGDL